MAEDNITNAVSQLYDPSTGEFDYEAFNRRIQETIGQTTQIFEPQLPEISPGLRQDPRVQAAISTYETSRGPLQQQAQKAATGLEMQAGQFTASQQYLTGLQADVAGRAASASEVWGAAAEQAKEYVEAAYRRTGEVVAKLEEMAADIGQNRNFAKAHDMNASVQATLGSMEASGRSIAERYGRDSKEYAQFEANKRLSLGTIQSSIHASYQKLQEAQDLNVLNAMNTAMWKMNMYTSFQEQQHVETMLATEKASQAYSLQAAQFQVGVEQLKMVGMENMANWIIETPEFVMDIQPLISILSDIAAERMEAMGMAGRGGESYYGREPGAYASPGWETRTAPGAMPWMAPTAGGGLRPEYQAVRT